MLEKRIEGRLKARTDRAGGMCIKLVVLSVAGLPDRLILLPKAKMMFIELKAPGKVASPLQNYIHKKIRSLGFEVYVVDSMEAVDALFT
jgi:hypothetical protein